MKFEQVCRTLGEYFSQHRLFRVLLPLSEAVMLVCAVLSILGNIISLGVLSSIIYMLFWTGVVLSLGKCNFKMVAAGFGIYTINYLLNIVLTLGRVQYLSIATLLYALLFGFFAYLAYKKSLMI